MNKFFLAILVTFQLGLATTTYSQNIAINGTGNLPDTSAMLDVSSTTKGFLAPRMTKTELDNIPLPAKGLLVFNTTSNAFNVNTGTTGAPVWTALSFVGGFTGVTSVNGLTTGVQTFATGTTGSNFNIVSSGSIHTLNIPDAAANARGVITTGAQTLAGNKTFSGAVSATALTGGAATDSIVSVDVAGLLKKRTVSSVLSGGSNALSNSVNTFTSTVNGVVATAPIVNTVANSNNTNTLTTTVNGITGTGATVINTNVLSLSGTTLTSTINGVASPVNLAPAIPASISSVNGLTTGVQTFATGTTGTNFNIVSSGSIHTLNIPDAGANARGLVTTGIQTMAGNKTFNGTITAASLATGASTDNIITADATGLLKKRTASSILAEGTNVISTSGNTITSVVNGVSNNTPVINSNSLTYSGTTLTSTINGIASPVNLAAAVTTVNGSDITLNATHSLVLIITGSTTRSVTLPTAVGIAGKIYTIKKIDSGNKGVTIACNGSETIDGSSTFNFKFQWEFLSIQSDGANWMIVGK